MTRKVSGRTLKTWPFLCVGLAAAIALTLGPALAQDANAPRPTRIWGGHRVNPILSILPILGGAVLAAPSANAPPPQSGGGLAPSSGARVYRASPAKTVPPAPKFVARAFPPPPGETRFRRGEILVEVSPATPPAFVAQIVRRHRLVEQAVVSIALLGASVRLWRIPDAREVASVARELAFEPSLASIQPNYLYVAQQDAPAASTGAATAPSPPQYSLAKLHVDAVAAPAPAEPVRVAVIDTAIDDSHPDLQGAIEARFDAIGGAAPPRTLEHGTSIAGAIAARGRLKGVDPNVRILSARAFDSEGAGPVGETLWLLEAIDWAARERASVVNMSFAGPPDPALHAILAAAFAKGVTLVAAAGNAGPKSPPLYPAADERALAVTATDADDKLYPKANVGGYIAVAAPGVDVLLPAPQASYALETGTSVSAALVSGVAALLIERRPAATPTEIRAWLTSTAEPLGGGGRSDEFGAGLVDARRAVNAADAAKPTK
ncbi:MAG: S8 family serine peptidase [Roseiarcus sp.]|jgi:subtilisin family serine protease